MAKYHYYCLTLQFDSNIQQHICLARGEKNAICMLVTLKDKRPVLSASVLRRYDIQLINILHHDYETCRFFLNYWPQDESSGEI